MLKRLLATLAALVLMVGLAACSDDDEGNDTATDNDGDATTCVYTADGSSDTEFPPEQPSVSGDVSATVATSAGDIDLTLDADAAPCTVNSFVSLAEQGYFDDTSCHRLTEGGGLSVLQCGDPTGTGTGGPGYAFDDELTGDETYPAGTLAMANAGPNTNGSQFFMVYADSQLSPDYTVFGTIGADGLAVLEDIAAVGPDAPGDGHPITPVNISSVTVE